MATDTTPADGERSDVMASVDDADGRAEFVIADVSVEDAWLSISDADAPSLPNWR